jgi:hypothetical protein
MTTPRFSILAVLAIVLPILGSIGGSIWYQASHNATFETKLDDNQTLVQSKLSDFQTYTRDQFVANDKQHEEVKASINKLADKLDNLSSCVRKDAASFTTSNGFVKVK